MNTDEIAAANLITRIAQAYCDAQSALSGETNPPIYDRQWQACCTVAGRFLADPGAITPQLCHHEWRLSQMNASHPQYWPSAARLDWDDLSPTDQYLERAGLAAMRQALRNHQWEEEERLAAYLQSDAQQQHDAENWGTKQ